MNLVDCNNVIHYGAPQSIEDYFQESGRVGRSGDHANRMHFGQYHAGLISCAGVHDCEIEMHIIVYLYSCLYASKFVYTNFVRFDH